MMRSEIKNLLDVCSVEELVEIREAANKLIKKRSAENLGRRKTKRVELNLAATCEVEREKQFFDREHKIVILDLSVNGLRFKIQEPLLKNDLLEVFFRSPSNGVKKKIDCQVIWVSEPQDQTATEYQIAAKGVNKEEVRRYKDWLSKRATEPSLQV